jgi:hypothetical protein
MAWSSPYAYVAGQTVTAANLNTYLSANLQYLYDNLYGVGRRNAIINSHFDVWQRGTSFTAASSTKTYCADRWAVYRAATGCTVSRISGPTGQAYGMWVKRDSGNSSTTLIYAYQALESLDSRKFAGQDAYLKLTLQAGANFSAASSAISVRVIYGTGTDESPDTTWTGQTDALSTSQVITTTSTTYDFGPVAIPTTATQIKVVLTFTPAGTAGAADGFVISGAQLAVDPTPGYEQLPYGETFALCQRYYQTGIGYWYGQATSGITHGATQSLPVVMRTTPTMAFTNVSNTSFGATSGSAAVDASTLLIARVATATAGGIFQETWTADAEL